jgi:hypothetical protein
VTCLYPLIPRRRVDFPTVKEESPLEDLSLYLITPNLRGRWDTIAKKPSGTMMFFHSDRPKAGRIRAPFLGVPSEISRRRPRIPAPASSSLSGGFVNWPGCPLLLPIKAIEGAPIGHAHPENRPFFVSARKGAGRATWMSAFLPIGPASPQQESLRPELGVEGNRLREPVRRFVLLRRSG